MSNETKLFRLSGSALVIDLRTGHNATLRPGLVVLSEDAHTHAMGALEAECERLQRRLDAADEWATMASEQLKERDALRTQLEAIRSAGGELAAWLSDKHVFAEKLCAAGWRDHADAQHTGCDELRQEFQRIVAAMAAELERAKEEVTRWHTLACNHSRAEDRLRAELEAARKQEPVAIANKGDCAFWVSWTEAGKPLRGPGIKLYALPPLAGQVVVPEWVPVSERLPDHGAPVLVAYKFGGIYTCRRSVIDHDLAADEPMHGERDRPTHWMQLPAAPALLATPSMEV